MIICPGFADQVQWFEMVNPTEELVQLGGHQELPGVGSTQGRPELVTLLGEVEHLVPGGGHPATASKARVGADKPEAAGEETVQQGIVWQVERLFSSQS